MGAYKRLNYRMRVLRWWPTKAEAIHLGIDLPLGGELPPEEERADAAEAKRERLEERKARAAVDREDARLAREAEKLAKAEAKAQAAALKAAKAAEPRTFAPAPGDFVQTGRVAPIVAGERQVHESGASSPWPSTANLYRGGLRAQAAVRDGLISPAHQDLRDRLGPPEPPGGSTGWYACGDSWCRVGQWPYPEYRPPGLVWRLHWTDPKPDDVPWEDELEVASVVLRCDEPQTTPRPMAARFTQRSLF